ncbi:MAG: HAMP domain-containing protein [Xanthomonadaceae bacterium]|nr:HAMP domain-containing protein [Xanthomonadaceae bacterium]
MAAARTKTSLDPRESKKRQRERWAIAVLSLIFIGLTVLEFRLTSVSSQLPFVNSIFFFGLLNLNIIILIALTWLVFRNIGKLFLERRSRILGARLKSKLVVAFITFAIVPTLALFIISTMYINSSFDKWFSLKVQNTLQASIEITNTYYKNADETGLHFAAHIAKLIAKNVENNPKFIPLDPTNPHIKEFLEAQRELLALHSVEFYTEVLDERIHTYQKHDANQALFYPRLSLDLLQKGFRGEKESIVENVGSGDLVRSIVLVKSLEDGHALGVLVVNTYVPVSLVSKKDEISSVFLDYQETNPLKYPIKTTYLVILVTITLVIVFVAIWMGLYLARELTVPVERLVHGAQAVGAGNLDVQIEASGKDEIAVLIQSFNKMIRDLKDSRVGLTERRIQLETVLANVGTGVLVTDAKGMITTFNRAAAGLLERDSKDLLGIHYSKVLTGESAPLIELISTCLTESENNGENEVTQWNYQGGKEAKTLAAVGTPLHDNNANWGVVVVIDDLTMLMKGQREMAWREVARRIAHEIKNPLTPIKLSAQRLQRRLVNLTGKDGQLLQECTATIIKHTDELKEMVNEFSSFARFPEVHLAPHSLNEALTEVVQLYSAAHPGVEFAYKPETRIPVFPFDRDQIKRVIINLIDNAVSAIQNSGIPHHRGILKIESHYNEKLQIAAIMVEDNGLGMTEEVRSRVFEPYFSTKQEGTGLGLAIAKRIVNDHNGFIRVQSSEGKGTVFIIELPTAEKNQSESSWLRMS